MRPNGNLGGAGGERRRAALPGHEVRHRGEGVEVLNREPDDGTGIWRILRFWVGDGGQGHAAANPGIGGVWTREEGERAGVGGPQFRIALSP